MEKLGLLEAIEEIKSEAKMLGNKISERYIRATLKYNELPAEDFDVVANELVKNDITVRMKKYIYDYTPEEHRRMMKLADRVEEILFKFSPRECMILRLRFGFATGRIETIEEIANEFDVTKETISEYENKVLIRLRSPKYQNAIGNICDILLELEDLNSLHSDEEEFGQISIFDDDGNLVFDDDDSSVDFVFDDDGNLVIVDDFVQEPNDNNSK